MAASALREGEDAVFLHAEDGCYVLVGLRRAEARVFTVLAQVINSKLSYLTLTVKP